MLFRSLGPPPTSPPRERPAHSSPSVSLSFLLCKMAILPHASLGYWEERRATALKIGHRCGALLLDTYKCNRQPCEWTCLVLLFPGLTLSRKLFPRLRTRTPEESSFRPLRVDSNCSLHSHHQQVEATAWLPSPLPLTLLQSSGAPIQQRWKLRPRKVTKLLQGHSRSYWWNRKGVA